MNSNYIFSSLTFLDLRISMSNSLPRICKQSSQSFHVQNPTLKSDTCILQPFLLNRTPSSSWLIKKNTHTCTHTHTPFFLSFTPTSAPTQSSVRLQKYAPPPAFYFSISTTTLLYKISSCLSPSLQHQPLAFQF